MLRLAPEGNGGPVDASEACDAVLDGWLEPLAAAARCSDQSVRAAAVAVAAAVRESDEARQLAADRGLSALLAGVAIDDVDGRQR